MVAKLRRGSFVIASKVIKLKFFGNIFLHFILFSSLPVFAGYPIETFFDFKMQFAQKQNSTPAKHCNYAMCKQLKKLIDSAQTNIDFSIYGIRNQDAIMNALITAKKRGVKIRGIVDTNNSKCGSNGSYTYTDTKILIQKLGGPQIVHCDNVSGYNYIMHNKFFVFDKESVWTGSTNISDTGLGGEYNSNVTITVKSRKLAKIYLEKFNDLYSGGFHQNGNDAGHHELRWRDGTRLKVYFSPKDDAFSHAIHPLIKNAKKTLYISMFFLTDLETVEHIIAAKNRGVDVRVIMDATGAGHRSSLDEMLCQSGISLKVENWGSKMHMKIAVADALEKGLATIIVGSQNWTHSGNSKNDENTLSIRNDKAAQMMHKEFLRLWSGLKNVSECSYINAESNSSSVCINDNCRSQCLSGACCDGIDNDHDGSIDGSDYMCKDRAS